MLSGNKRHGLARGLLKGFRDRLPIKALPGEEHLVSVWIEGGDSIAAALKAHRDSGNGTVHRLAGRTMHPVPFELQRQFTAVEASVAALD